MCDQCLLFEHKHTGYESLSAGVRNLSIVQYLLDRCCSFFSFCGTSRRVLSICILQNLWLMSHSHTLSYLSYYWAFPQHACALPSISKVNFIVAGLSCTGVAMNPLAGTITKVGITLKRKQKYRISFYSNTVGRWLSYSHCKFF